MKEKKVAALLVIIVALALLALGPGCKQEVTGTTSAAGQFSTCYTAYPNDDTNYSTGYVKMLNNLSGALGNDSLSNDSLPDDTVTCDTNTLAVRTYSRHNGSEEWRAAHDFKKSSSWLTKRGWSRFDFGALTPPGGTHLVACTLGFRQYYAWCRPSSAGYPHCEIDLLSIDPVHSSARQIFDAFGTALKTDIPSQSPPGWITVPLPPISVSSGAAFSIALGWKVYEPNGDDPGPLGVNEFGYAQGARPQISRPWLKLVYDC